MYTSRIALHHNSRIIRSVHGLSWPIALILAQVNQSSTERVVYVELSEIKESWHRWSMIIMCVWQAAGLPAVTDTIRFDRCQTPWPHLSVTYAHDMTHADTEALWVTHYASDLRHDAGNIPSNSLHTAVKLFCIWFCNMKKYLLMNTWSSHANFRCLTHVFNPSVYTFQPLGHPSLKL